MCENPTVVEVVAERWAAADVSGGVGPVLVCTSGQPSTAVVELLQILTADGAEVRYHGDFDWAGLRIAWSLRTPRRVDAVALHGRRLSRGCPERQALAPTGWDSGAVSRGIRSWRSS